jgi:hypothetical protein
MNFEAQNGRKVFSTTIAGKFDPVDTDLKKTYSTC